MVWICTFCGFKNYFSNVSMDDLPYAGGLWCHDCHERWIHEAEYRALVQKRATIRRDRFYCFLLNLFSIILFLGILTGATWWLIYQLQT